MNINNDQSSDTKVVIDQTSQAKEGGWSLTEGKSGTVTPMVSWGTEGAPTGIDTKVAMQDDFKTSQQLRGEFSLSEGEAVLKSEKAAEA